MVSLPLSLSSWKTQRFSAFCTSVIFLYKLRRNYKRTHLGRLVGGHSLDKVRLSFLLGQSRPLFFEVRVGEGLCCVWQFSDCSLSIYYYTIKHLSSGSFSLPVPVHSGNVYIANRIFSHKLFGGEFTGSYPSADCLGASTANLSGFYNRNIFYLHWSYNTT